MLHSTCVIDIPMLGFRATLTLFEINEGTLAWTMYLVPESDGSNILCPARDRCVELLLGFLWELGPNDHQGESPFEWDESSTSPPSATQASSMGRCSSHRLNEMEWCQEDDRLDVKLYGEKLAQIITTIDKDTFNVTVESAGSTDLVAMDRSTGHLFCTTVPDKGLQDRGRGGCGLSGTQKVLQTAKRTRSPMCPWAHI